MGEVWNFGNGIATNYHYSCIDSTAIGILILKASNFILFDVLPLNESLLPKSGDLNAPQVGQLGNWMMCRYLLYG